MDFDAVSTAALAAEREQGPHGARVVRVTCEADRLPDLWCGAYGDAPVQQGPPGFTLSNGQRIDL